LADIATDVANEAVGTYVIVAGLLLQVFSITASILLYAKVFWKVKYNKVQAATTECVLQEIVKPFTKVKGYKFFLSGTVPRSPSPFLTPLLIDV
jgi:hypothetical protein